MKTKRFFQTAPTPKSIRWGALLGLLCLSLLMGLAVVSSAVALAGAGESDDIHLFVDINDPDCDDANPGTTESPLCHIQAAADRAVPGTTVHVREGTYQEEVEVRTSGTAGAPISFVTDNNERVIINSPGEACFDLHNVEYIKIHGFELTGAWMPPASAAPPPDTDVTPAHAAGIRAFPLDENGFGVRYSLFTKNIIHGNDAGIWLVYGHNNVISNNVIYGNGEASIRIKRGDYNQIVNNLVFNNGSNEKWGITFYCSEGTVVRHNTIVESGGGAVYIYEGTSNLNGEEPGSDGFCKPSNHAQVFDNIGVVIGYVAGQSAPLVIGSSTTTDRDPLLDVLYGPLDNEYHHNLWFNKWHPDNVVSWGDFNERSTWAFYGLLTLEEFQLKHEGYGAFSIAAHPLFVDPVNNDFRLLPDSPAIGAASDGKDMGVIFDTLPVVEYASLPSFFYDGFPVYLPLITK